jgi:hypothetical protein
MHNAICHAAARFRLDASARCFVAHRHNLDVKCRFVATPFQLPLFNFYERVSSLPIDGRLRFNHETETDVAHSQLLRVSTSHQHLRCRFGGARDVLNSSTSSLTCTFVAAMDGNAGTRRRADTNGHGTPSRCWLVTAAHVTLAHCDCASSRWS